MKAATLAAARAPALDDTVLARFSEGVVDRGLEHVERAPAPLPQAGPGAVA